MAPSGLHCVRDRLELLRFRRRCLFHDSGECGRKGRLSNLLSHHSGSVLVVLCKNDIFAQVRNPTIMEAIKGAKILKVLNEFSGFSSF